MIIVSQDKKRTTKNMELFTDMIIENNEPVVYGIYADKSNAYLNLGIYKTEERAKEVLQEIITRYKNWENIKVGQPDGECSPVYEMPKE